MIAAYPTPAAPRNSVKSACSGWQLYSEFQRGRSHRGTLGADTTKAARGGSEQQADSAAQLDASKQHIAFHHVAFVVRAYRHHAAEFKAALIKIGENVVR